MPRRSIGTSASAPAAETTSPRPSGMAKPAGRTPYHPAARNARPTNLQRCDPTMSVRSMWWTNARKTALSSYAATNPRVGAARKPNRTRGGRPGWSTTPARPARRCGKPSQDRHHAEHPGGGGAHVVDVAGHDDHLRSHSSHEYVYTHTFPKRGEPTYSPAPSMASPSAPSALDRPDGPAFYTAARTGRKLEHPFSASGLLVTAEATRVRRACREPGRRRRRSTATSWWRCCPRATTSCRPDAGCVRVS